MNYTLLLYNDESAFAHVTPPHEPLRAGREEVRANPRARSARLRIVERGAAASGALDAGHPDSAHAVHDHRPRQTCRVEHTHCIGS
jgi:hypothetical protein